VPLATRQIGAANHAGAIRIEQNGSAAIARGRGRFIKRDASAELFGSLIEPAEEE
jgi:hypothetical protein